MVETSGVRGLLHKANAPGNAWMAALLVAGACVAVNAAAWFPMQYPPRWIGELVGVVAPFTCAHHPADSWQYDVCGWGLAGFALSGTMIVAGLLFAFRRTLRRGMHRLARLLPVESQFLWAPIIATLIFTMAWASIPFHSFLRFGLIPDGFFPALVGLFTWALLRARRAVFRRMPKVMARRDRLPEAVKYVIAFAVVVAAAWLITRFVPIEPPMRDQIVALFSLFVTFALWAPRVRAARARETQAEPPAEATA